MLDEPVYSQRNSATMQGCTAEDASTTHNNVEKNNKIDQGANIASFIDSPANNVDRTDLFDSHNGSNSRKENLPENEEAACHSVFPKGTRIFIVTMAAVCGVVSPLSGNIFYPALNPLSADLHVNQSLINVSLTTYMIFQGISPTLMGNLADTTGRRPAYIIGFTMYIGACIGLALQTSYPALLVLRCLQSSGSSSTIALGTAIAADVATAAERGTYMGLVNGGALVGPALGPVLGGILVTFLGWRSIFWFLAIFSGVLLFLLVLAVPETGRNVVGNGSIPPQQWNRDLISVLRARWRVAKPQTPRDENSSPHSIPRESGKRKVRMPNPLATLKILKEKDVRLLLLYNCLVYASYFSVTSSLPYIFAQTYGFNDLQIGLSYLPYGVGALLASLFNGQVLDWRFRQVAKAAGFEIIKGQTTDTRNFPLEKVRFPIALILILIGNSALLCYGWVFLSFFSLAPKEKKMMSSNQSSYIMI